MPIKSALLPLQAIQTTSPINAKMPSIPFPKPNALLEVKELDDLVFEKNVDIPLKDGQGLCRGNVYRPKGEGKWPVILTCKCCFPRDAHPANCSIYVDVICELDGPYGKDLPYSDFHGNSFKEIPDEQKSELSSWETPHPNYWVAQGYVVVRVDERGLGSSYGSLDTMSDQTSSDFAEVIEWCADQKWSTGKIGLLGIS